MAPTLLHEGGLRFYFFSREETRWHLHVSHPDGEAKFRIAPTVELASSRGLSARQLRHARQLIVAHQWEFEHAWKTHLEVEISNIGAGGFTLSLAGERLFLSYADFPWFAGVALTRLRDVVRPSPDHLYWPSLDIDLSVASIRDPAAFPLVSTELPK